MRKKVLVIGDSIVEYRGQAKRAGGALNVAAHLMQETDVTILVPTQDSGHLAELFQGSHLESVALNGFISLLGQRHWINEDTIGSNPCRVKVNTQVLRKELLKLINSYDAVYIEWHFKHEVSIVPAILRACPELLKDQVVFFDCRQPDEIGSFLAPLVRSAKEFFWKMNDKEHSRFLHSERNYYSELCFYLIQTHGKYGLVACDWKDGIADTSEAIWMGGYDIPHEPGAHFSGCGDSFFSTFCIAKMKEIDHVAALTLATIAGGISASKPFTYVTNYGEICNVYTTEESLSGSRWRTIKEVCS